MPELPEVETIRLGLLDRVSNKRIESVEVRCERIILRPRPQELAAALAGQTIRDIRRRGKFLIFETDDYKLLIHLGMSGQLTYWDRGSERRRKVLHHPDRVAEGSPARHRQAHPRELLLQ